MSRLRDIALKIAVWAKATVRRVVLRLPQGAPAPAEWLTSARRLGRVWPSVAGVRRFRKGGEPPTGGVGQDKCVCWTAWSRNRSKELCTLPD